jgi:D-glycero-D-manno-heptose 1,7-bisphosphate phosphatase
VTNSALFLDRDGVINVERNYVYRIEDFEFVPGIFELCAAARDLGHRIVVVTNQAGIGRGYYGEAEFASLTAWMLARFAERGVEIARVYHCPYHPTAGIGEYRRNSFDRKPNPGMLLKARDDLHLDLARCALIGDHDTDIAAGAAAGVGRLIKFEPCATEAVRHDGRVIAVNSLQAAAAQLGATVSNALRG